MLSCLKISFIRFCLVKCTVFQNLNFDLLLDVNKPLKANRFYFIFLLPFLHVVVRFFYNYYRLTIIRKFTITSCIKLLCASAGYCMVLFHFQNPKISSLYGSGIKRIFQNVNIECLGNSTLSLWWAEITNSHTISRAVHWLLLHPHNHALEEESDVPGSLHAPSQQFQLHSV